MELENKKMSPTRSAPKQYAGPSTPFQKWSGGRNQRVPNAREGDHSPYRKGGLGVSPEKNFEFWALLCAFLMGFFAFGTRFQLFWSRSFARKDIFCHARNQMQDKIVFRQSRFLFSTACFFDIISSMSPQGLESTFSTDSWWYFKESCFRKDIHLV